MIAIKRMRIKIEKQSKSYIDWRMKLKTKINLVKGSKNIQKNEDQDQNWHKKNNVLIEGWNWKE
jgi:hypothetical protein